MGEIIKATETSDYVIWLLKALNNKIREKKVTDKDLQNNTKWLGITIPMPPIRQVFERACLLFQEEIDKIVVLTDKDLKEKYGELDVADIRDVAEYFERVFVILEKIPAELQEEGGIYEIQIGAHEKKK